MAALNNVVIIEQQETVFNHINTWISSHSNHSDNTAKAYENDIRLFFKTLKKKELENLEPSDLKVNPSQVLNYQSLLVKSNEYKHSSINRMINSVRSLYRFLKGHEYDVNPDVFGLVKNLADDTVHTGTLSVDEALMLSELALTEQRDGLRKKAFILVATTTSIRKDALTKLKLSHIRKNEKVDGMYIISSDELFDKGKMIYKDLNGDIYNLLVEVQNGKSEDEEIFNFSHAGIDQMIKRLCDKAGIDPKRRISMHSLKKTGVKFAYDTHGLRAAQMQAGHSSPVTTSNSYLEKETNIAANMYNQIDESVFDELSRDEMLVLLRSFGNGVGSQLRQKAKEIVEKRG